MLLSALFQHEAIGYLGKSRAGENQKCLNKALVTKKATEIVLLCC